MNDEPAKDAPLSDEERARALREQLRQVHAFDLAFEMAVSLVSFGYQKLGLTAETRELRDLGDARVAIELLRAELDVLSRELGEARLGDLRATLAQLQLSYARAVGAAGEGAGAGAAAGESATPETPAGRPSAQAEEPQAPAAAPAASASLADEDAAPATQERRPAPKKPAPAKAAAKKKPAARKKPAAPKRPAGAGRAARRKGSAGEKDEPAT